MHPVIASYSDFSAGSVHKIQPKYDPLPVYSNKRKKLPKEKKENSHISCFKASDEFSVRPLYLLDSAVKEKQKEDLKEKRVKSIVKPKLDNVSTQPRVEWDFKPISKHREGWLFSLVKPESEFTPKVVAKKIPVSLAAVVMKNIAMIQEKERNEKGKEKVNEDQEYSCHDREVLKSRGKDSKSNGEKFGSNRKNSEKYANSGENTEKVQGRSSKGNSDQIEGSSNQALSDLKRHYNIT